MHDQRETPFNQIEEHDERWTRGFSAVHLWDVAGSSFLAAAQETGVVLSL